VAAPELTEFKPARPPAIKLVDEKFLRCGKMACIPAADAQRLLQNKVEIYSWMTGMNAVVDYYEGRPTPTAPLSIVPVAATQHSHLLSRFRKVSQ
jgi:hypothetical protein